MRIEIEIDYITKSGKPVSKFEVTDIPSNKPLIELQTLSQGIRKKIEHRGHTVLDVTFKINL